ncbi:MAG: class I SAM-dependent rRNA methyltransferase [Gemmatimonadales bacterium]
MKPAAGARVSARGAGRWQRGHPWIYRSDVLDAPDTPGVVSVTDSKGRWLGQALLSPRSEIRLRLLEPTPRPIDSAWWRERLAACLARRGEIDASAYRLVHGEGDGLPSLVVDRYDRWLVAQLLSAGLDTMRDTVVAQLVELLRPEGVLLRHDVATRTREGLPEETVLAHGTVPERIEVREGTVRYLADPWQGQKTGAFLDQRPNRLLAGRLMPSGGVALDAFAYHGSFALHLAERAQRVVAIDSSAEALARGREHAALNRRANIEWVEGDVFEKLREFEHRAFRFEMIVLDPPAFAKSRAALGAAMRGYQEINLRAMRLLTPGGTLLTASCSFHLRRPEFLAMLADAAADSGRRLTLTHLLGQGPDHPEVVTIPETGYLKGAVLKAE